MNIMLAPAKTGNPWHMAVEDGNEVQWVPYTPRNPNLKVEANFGVQVAFEKIGTLERKPVIPLLVECLNYIETVVGEFARVFWPSETRPNP